MSPPFPLVSGVVAGIVATVATVLTGEGLTKAVKTGVIAGGTAATTTWVVGRRILSSTAERTERQESST
ncbi:hypothetical protein [Haladaptatus sp. NG-WS-4]